MTRSAAKSIPLGMSIQPYQAVPSVFVLFHGLEGENPYAMEVHATYDSAKSTIESEGYVMSGTQFRHPSMEKSHIVAWIGVHPIKGIPS